MSDNENQPDATLLGYELREKIGSGGYGEVWSAVAPGGLRKAVKYIFGDQFDKRAASELHALEKIKSVRHPFLLSLERIEVVDGRLLVVSELADGSLRDRFHECLQQGLPGIPREELLGYLSDAAEALDYISDNEDLAHLDIKPENLLLVAGHVKVADFGLVKSLNNQSQASLVGGMTPAYAAPEVFRGVPSRQSDQYSLAILFQEMLTGTLPFAGVNAAELTLQHMNDDPDLSRLGEGDRFAIARALSKESENRFESCRALVGAIRTAESRFGSAPVSSEPAATPRPIATPRRAVPASHSVTEVFDGPAESLNAATHDSNINTPEALPEPQPRESDPAELQVVSDPFAAAPAVFIGVGGVGARVLRSLRAQTIARLGLKGGAPSAPMLLLDTDAQTLASATRADERGRGLDASETLTLPLRRPQAYREKSDLLLRWLGRRWLYNIPKSLRTEGIRPLGRLALVDHARQAFQRLRCVIVDALDEANRAETSDATGIDFSAPGVRVYVVASSAGAAGSGMTLDLAYAARSILNRMGVEDAKVIGLIAHSTVRDATRCELAKVNSYAWLSEYECHRTRAQGYPGDGSIGLPEHEPGVPAFDHTYFVPLGDRVDTPVFDSGVDALAEYLFADAFTPGQRVLDACRENDQHANGLRSIAVSHPNRDSIPPLGSVQQAAISRMIDHWIGGAGSTRTPDPQEHKSTDQVVHGAVAFLGRTQLDSSTVASNCRSLIEASLGGDATAYAEACLSADGGSFEAAIVKINQCFGAESSDQPPAEVDGKPIESIVEPIVGKLVNETCAWILGKVNSPQERVDGASKAVDWMRDHLSAIEADLSKVAAHIDADHQRLLNQPPEAAGPETAMKLFQARLTQASLVAAGRITARLRANVDSLPGELDAMRRAAVEIKARLVDDASAAEAALQEVARLAVTLEQRLQEDYLVAQDGLLGALSDTTAVDDLAKTVAYAAAKCAKEGAPSLRAAHAEEFASSFAEPSFADCGGEFWRLNLDLPPSDSEAAPGPEDSLLVTELAGASLRHVAAGVIEGRRDYAAFAERVRTRRDVAWVDAIEGVVTEANKSASFPTVSTDSQPQATAVMA